MLSKNRLAIVLIALFSLVQLLSLSRPPALVFDENHYVKEARLISRGHPDYNIEHPPLGKQIIAASIKLLGDNPWGWRVPSVLLSIATVVLVFLFAKKFFGETAALLATLLLVSDPLWIAISRLAMLDIFATFFAVLSFVLAFYYLENPSLKLAAASGVALGISLATKWTATFLPFFFISIITSSYYLKRLKVKTLASHFFLFLFAILAIYLLSYFPALKTQARPTFTERLFFPFFFHLGAKGYTDVAFALDPFLWFITPIFGTAPVFDENSSKIILFFNPLSGWVLLASIYSLIRGMAKNLSYKVGHENIKVIFTILAWFLLYLPWLTHLRVAFTYHIFPLLPFVYLIQAKFGTTILMKKGWGRLLFKGYLITTIFCTAFLAPFLLGLPVSNRCAYSLFFSLLALAVSFTILILELFSPGKVLNFLRRQT